MFEALVRDALVEYWEANNLIRASQHGFSKGRSCLTNLLMFLDGVTDGLNRGESVDVIFLDFAKAFDKVPHERLLRKMEAYGIGARCWLGLGNGWEIESRGWNQGVAGRNGAGYWAVSRRARCWDRYCSWFLLMIWMRSWAARYWNLWMIPRFMEGSTVRRIEIGCREIWRDWLNGQTGGKWVSMLESVKWCIWVSNLEWNYVMRQQRLKVVEVRDFGVVLQRRRNRSALQSTSVPDWTYIREESWLHYRSRVKHAGPNCQSCYYQLCQIRTVRHSHHHPSKLWFMPSSARESISPTAFSMGQVPTSLTDSNRT